MGALIWAAAGDARWYALSSVVLTHAALTLLERAAGAGTQRPMGAPCRVVLRGQPSVAASPGWWGGRLRAPGARHDKGPPCPLG